MPHLVDLRTGRVQQLNGRRTAYAKQGRAGPVLATADGLEGDAVGNRRVHGGPEKAIYAFGEPGYGRWIADRPDQAARLVSGAFGENLLWSDLDEGSVCIGDRWRIGEALLEVCQPRQPCETMARWFDDPAMVKAMVRNSRSGWYCRVVEPGRMARGDPLVLEHRPDSAWTVAAVLEASYRKPSQPAELLALSTAPGLAREWAAWARHNSESDRPRAKPV